MSATQRYDNTVCGFTTLPPTPLYNGAQYHAGKFNGMQGAAQAKQRGQDLSPECNQEMCASRDSNFAVTDLRVFFTWAGTDSTGRNLVSKGFSYESFRQYSVSRAAWTWVDAAKTAGAKAASCVTDKDCEGVGHADR